MTPDYEKAISELTSQGKFYIDLGLDRITKVMELLNNPQDSLTFIHVAGTNGKGSVCATLSSIIAQKYKVGLFTSPHIFEYTERIQINGEPISKDDFARIFEKVLATANENRIHLTEFELLTAMSFCYFKEKNVDIVIMEVGLGGRLDSTNIIKNPLCSIITHIDFDHTERLGNTIEKIAFEKSGIIKPLCPVIFSIKNKGKKIIENIAKEKKSKYYEVEDYPELPTEMSLKGSYQKENLALVMKSIEIIKLKLTDEDIKNGLAEVKHKCRFEYLKEENIIIDGAHNPNGMDMLHKSLNEYFPNKKRCFIYGCLKNKDYKKMVQSLFEKGDEIYFYHFSHSNSATKEEVQNVCSERLLDYREYKRDKTKLTVICGSFYMIKELLSDLGIKHS